MQSERSIGNCLFWYTTSTHTHKLTRHPDVRFSNGVLIAAPHLWLLHVKCLLRVRFLLFLHKCFHLILILLFLHCFFSSSHFTKHTRKKKKNLLRNDFTNVKHKRMNAITATREFRNIHFALTRNQSPLRKLGDSDSFIELNVVDVVNADSIRVYCSPTKCMNIE